MKRTLISVTAKHIASNSHISTMCPLALAIEAATGRQVSVVCDVMFFSKIVDKWRSPTFPLSRRALCWRRAFDKGKTMKPFRFYLMVPQ